MKHYNPSISNRMSRFFNLKGENTDEVRDEIVAVVPLIPVANIVKQAVRTTSGSVTVYTTPADREFFLSALTMSYECNAACDTLGIECYIYVDGVQIPFVRLNKLTLTARADSMTWSFPNPIRIDKNSVISFYCTYSAGSCSFNGTIVGYLEETNRGS